MLMTYRYFVLFAAFLLFSARSWSQCMTYPVPFEQRVNKSVSIVQGKVTAQHGYIDDKTGNIYTLNEFTIAAWLKGYQPKDKVYVITVGGVVGNKAMRADPALELDTYHEYLLMLEADNTTIGDKAFREQHPDALQALTYADAQGSLTNERNFYHDLHYRTPQTETALFSRIAGLTGQTAKTPQGLAFTPRSSFAPPPVADVITSFSPTTSYAGTIVTSDYITISGSSFGAAAGTVFYTNADDGGATSTSSGVATDNVSWSATSIQNKIAASAGTGPINVNGVMTSGTNLTVDYAHLNINSNYSGFGSSTRQRYYLRNKNGLGGYTYTYNSSFYLNTAAVNAFERALLLWRCSSFINWRTTSTTSSVSSSVSDGINLILFDATLPAGVLGRATSRFLGLGNGACNLDNTVWWLDELDIQFYPDPPVSGFPWQFGPASPSFSEYDFESVALHELGHHHGLGHVINTGLVMHFSLANGEEKRTLHATDIAGGSAKMAYSTSATCFNPGTAGTPMVALTVGNCILPIQLIDFTGERKNSTTNQLYWNTAQESNNKGFYLDRSADGNLFSNIAFVAGAGNSTQPRNYTYADDKAGFIPLYYRLRQVDLDGRERFSKIIYLPGDAAADRKVWTDGNGQFIRFYNSPQVTKAARFELYAASGQIVIAHYLSKDIKSIPAGHLARGVYFYRLFTDTESLSGKLFLGGK